MQRRRSLLALVIAGIVPAAVSLSGLRSLASEDDDAILRAYMEGSGIAAEIQEYRSHGYRDEGARALLISGVCGVAGCSSEYLVVHQFSYYGTNPQNRSILARVHRGPLTQVVRVERVELSRPQGQPAGEGDPPARRKPGVASKAPGSAPKRTPEPTVPNP